MENKNSRFSHFIVQRCVAAFILYLAISFGFDTDAFGDAYRYSPANKVDPFSPLPLLRPSIKGVTRLQEYELSELELIGTIMGTEVSALILTPDPREGILSKVGDRIGKRGGTIVAISRNKIVVREPTVSMVPGSRGKFTDTTMILSQPKKKDGEKDKSVTAGADNLNFKNGAVPGSAAPSPGFPTAGGIPPPPPVPSNLRSSGGFSGQPAGPSGESR